MANYDFDYLIEKMESQDFELNPFKHIYIEDFFSNEHFDEIISSAEISAPVAKDDKQLIDGLLEKGFKPIQFPGCVTNVSKYINWHQNNGKVSHHTTCEGSGMAFRLFQFPSKIFIVKDFPRASLNKISKYLLKKDISKFTNERNVLK